LKGPLKGKTITKRPLFPKEGTQGKRARVKGESMYKLQKSVSEIEEKSNQLD